MYAYPHSTTRVCLSRVFGYAQHNIYRSNVPLVSWHKKTADVGVFLSNHLSLDIVSNCNKTFCPIIIKLNAIDCGRIHSIFSENDQAVGDVIRMKLEKVQQVLLTIAYKRMASRHHSSPLLTETFEPERSLNILRPEEHDCIEVRVASHLRRYCLRCILKEV